MPSNFKDERAMFFAIELRKGFEKQQYFACRALRPQLNKRNWNYFRFSGKVLTEAESSKEFALLNSPTRSS